MINVLAHNTLQALFLGLPILVAIGTWLITKPLPGQASVTVKVHGISLTPLILAYRVLLVNLAVLGELHWTLFACYKLGLLPPSDMPGLLPFITVGELLTYPVLLWLGLLGLAKLRCNAS